MRSGRLAGVGGGESDETGTCHSLLLSNQTPTREAESLSVLKEEVEEVVHSMKAEKSSGVNNISSELLSVSVL